MASDNPDEWWRHAPEGQQKNSPSGQWPAPGGQASAGGPVPPGAPWGQTGGPMPQPGPQQQSAWEIPPLGSGSGGPPSKNNGPLIAVLAVVVVLVLAGVVGLVALSRGPNSEPTNTAGGTATATSVSAAPSASASSTTTPTTSSAPGEPELREGLAPVAVVGPTWEDGADTYTMAFQDWPFAFRTPGSWGCMEGSLENFPDALAWRCLDESDSDAGQKVDLILRKCEPACDEATRKQYDEDFYEEPGAPTEVDDRTSYVETAAGDTGEYVIQMSRFFAEEPGGEMVWHVGARGSGPTDTKDAVLKTVNDVATQTQ